MQMLQAKKGHWFVTIVTSKEGAMIKRYCYKQRRVYEKLQSVQVRIGHWEVETVIKKYLRRRFKKNNAWHDTSLPIVCRLRSTKLISVN